MAIPVDLNDLAEARNLDMLWQLHILMGQVLAQARAVSSTAILQTVRSSLVVSEGRSGSESSETTTSQITEESPRVPGPETPLPDVVLQSSSAERSDATSETHSWVEIGADLKRIAGQLLSTDTLEQKANQNKEDNKSQIKDGQEDKSLLSLLYVPLGGSVWTTVALLVGWGLLSRTR